MLLNEFTNRNKSFAVMSAALVEHYGINVDFEGMTKERADKIVESTKQKLAATTDMQKRVKYDAVLETFKLWESEVLIEGIDDDAVEEAKVIIAAKEISDKIQAMIEDVAKMQVQDLLPIVDAMKTEVGEIEAEQFAATGDDVLGTLVDALKTAKDGYEGAISAAQGEAPATDMDNFGDLDMDASSDMDMDMDMDMDAAPADEMDLDIDEFGADEVTDLEEPNGRERKEEV